MKKWPLILLLSGMVQPSFTQPVKTLSLQEAHRKAIDAHPLGKRSGLLEEATELRLEQTDASRLPEINLLASARLQSENVRSPFEIPGQGPIELPLFIAQAAIDAQYLIYDGGATQAQRQLAEAGLLADQQKVTTDLFQLEERVNEPFFSILLLRSQQQILESNLSDLQAKISQLEAGVRHGAIMESDVDKLKVEALRLESGIAQTRGQIRALFATLSDLTAENLDENTVLTLPDLDSISFSGALERPELRHFELQKNHILANEALISASRKPRISAYAQAGIGYPNPLNFFDTEPSPFALVGLRFSWKIFDWKKGSIDRQLITVQSYLVDNQQEVFEHNIEVEESQFEERMATLEQLIEQDQSIVALQEKISSRVSAQLNQGVITPAEYLDQVNDGIRSRLDLETHRLQLQQLKADYLTKKGWLKS